MKIYTKQHLLQALKKAGLPHTYKSLLNFERQQVIGRGGELESASNDRYFTEKEIADIVSKIKSYRQNGA